MAGLIFFCQNRAVVIMGEPEASPSLGLPEEYTDPTA